MELSNKYNICLQNVVEWQFEVAAIGNTQAKNRYLQNCTLLD